MKDCPFCLFITGELEGIILHQDQICSAILSMQPINPGHLLVVPNQHIQDLDELPDETADHLFRLGRQIARAVRESGVKCEGINFYLADGRAADQKIPHLHLHIIPRFEDDGFIIQTSPRAAELPTREELLKNAHHIQKALEKHPIQD
jgi:histidine triad (HIT) family protein